MILSQHTFITFVTIMILGLAGGWAIVDSVRLVRVLREDRSDAEVRDRIFGCIMGIVIATLGLGGVVHFYATT